MVPESPVPESLLLIVLGMREVPTAKEREEAHFLERAISHGLKGGSPPESATLKNLGKVCRMGRELYSLRKLTPFYYNNSSISLAVNKFSEEAGIPLAGTISLPPYGEVRSATVDFLNILRFGDSRLADEFYLNDGGKAVIDSYVGTALGALAAAGGALRGYSLALLENGAAAEAEKFLKKCEEGVFPLLNPKKKWGSALEMANSLSDALDGKNGISSTRGLERATIKAREWMHGAKPFMQKRQAYATEAEGRALLAAGRKIK